MNNIHPSVAMSPSAPTHLLGFPIAKVLHRLDSLMMVLKSCKARECTHPWETLHPTGNVQSLHDALTPRFDKYYAEEVDRVSFSRCEKGYILDAEGPQHVSAFRDGLHWSEWV